MLIEYSPNNSGGDWWLNDDDWKNLEKNGWFVIWADRVFDFGKDGNYQFDDKGFPKLKDEPDSLSVKDKNGDYRFFGALARYAFKHFDSLEDAVSEWESITGEDAEAEGCECCGRPHYFSVENIK